MGFFGLRGDGFKSGLADAVVANGSIVVAPAKKNGDKPKSFLERLQQITFLILICLLGFTVVSAILLSVYKAGQQTIGRDLQEFSTPRLDSNNAIQLDDRVIRDWTLYTRQNHVIDRKIGGISLADSLIGDPSDHILLGLFERDRIRRKTEAALHFYLAASNGHPDAYRLYKSLNIPTEDYEELYLRFVRLHEMNGDIGLLRLGQYYLGKDVFKIARRMTTRLRFTEPNDYILPHQNQAEDLAYAYFHMASLCGLASAYEWRGEMSNYYNFTVSHENSLKKRANNRLGSLAQRFSGGFTGRQDEFCSRAHLTESLDSFKELYMDRVAVQYESQLQGWDGRSNPCDLDIGTFSDQECDEFDSVIRGGYSGVASNIPTFEDLLTLVEGGSYDRRESRRTGADYDEDPEAGYRSGSGSWSEKRGSRNLTGGYDYVEDGLPRDCLVYGETGECYTREPALSCSDSAKYHFNRGEADMAVGRVERARDKFNRALDVGRPCQSEYAELAAKRLAALNLTCEYTVESLARISREYASNPTGGAIVDLKTRQRALSAKGYYEDEIDGEYGPSTRQAVRNFQRELGYSETGDLTPIETVYLMCSASQVNADAKSMNMLGVMYIAGLGVVQNTDAGLRLLKQAAERGDADSKFNLALIYGSGTVLSSYQLCGIVENLQIADSYLREASSAGHIPAQRLVRKFGQFGPTERWDLIKQDLLLNSFYLDRLEAVGEACRPNPGTLSPPPNVP